MGASQKPTAKPTGEAGLDKAKRSNTPTSWESKADRILAATGQPHRLALDPAVLKKKAQAQGALLTARLGSRTHRARWPGDMIRQFLYELRAIRTGTWFPHMLRPRHKDLDKAFHGLLVSSGAAAETEAQQNLDEILTSPDD